MDILHEFIQTMHSRAIPENQAPMKAYMKGQFEYLGIKSTERKEIFIGYKKAMRELNQPGLVIRELWRQPEREFQYCAMEFMEYAKYYRLPNSIQHIEELILDKSWWDTVDALASNHAGPYFRQHPNERDLWINKWDLSDNMWLNRTAIIFQLKYKLKTDTDLLFAIIENHIDSNEFFIRKAIGWALRELSKHQQELVRQFVEDHPDLSGLSVREASKYL